MPATGVEGAAMSRSCIKPGLEGGAAGLDGVGEGARHAHRIGGGGNRGVQQHGVVAHLHGLGGMRRRADAGIDDQRHAGKYSRRVCSA